METWLKSAMNQVMEELENERWANLGPHDPSLSVSTQLPALLHTHTHTHTHTSTRTSTNQGPHDPSLSVSTQLPALLHTHTHTHTSTRTSTNLRTPRPLAVCKLTVPCTKYPSLSTSIVAELCSNTGNSILCIDVYTQSQHSHTFTCCSSAPWSSSSSRARLILSGRTRRRRRTAGRRWTTAAPAPPAP